MPHEHSKCNGFASPCVALEPPWFSRGTMYPLRGDVGVQVLTGRAEGGSAPTTFDTASAPFLLRHFKTIAMVAGQNGIPPALLKRCLELNWQGAIAKERVPYVFSYALYHQ